MIDLTGSLIVLTRDDPAIAAVVAGRVGNDDLLVNGVVPMVVIRGDLTDLYPGGQDNGRIGKQEGWYQALCYGKTRNEAEHLARLVATSWNQTGIRVGTNGARIRQTWVPQMAGAVNGVGRVTKPFATVLIRVLAEAQPL